MELSLAPETLDSRDYFSWASLLTPGEGTVVDEAIAAPDSLLLPHGLSNLPAGAPPLATIFRLFRSYTHYDLLGIGKDASVFRAGESDKILKVYCSKISLREQMRNAAILLGERFDPRQGYNPFKFSIWKLGVFGLEFDYRLRRDCQFLQAAQEAGFWFPDVSGYGVFRSERCFFFVQRSKVARGAPFEDDAKRRASRRALEFSGRGVFIDLESSSNFLSGRSSHPGHPSEIRYLDLLYPDFSHLPADEVLSRLLEIRLSGLRDVTEVAGWLEEER